MAIVKANRFAPGGESRLEQDLQPATESATGFLKKMMERSGNSKGRANALRTTAKLAALSALTGENPLVLAETVADIAVQAAEEMGYDTSGDSNELSMAMPVLARASTEAVASYAQGVMIETGRVDQALDGVKAGAKNLAKSLAAFSKNPVLAKYVSTYQDFDADARISISLSSIDAIAKMLPEIQRFDFGVGQKKAIQFCANTIASGFSSRIGIVVEEDLSEIKAAHRVMLINSFYKTAAEVFHACWQNEVRRTRIGIKKARQANVSQEDLVAAVKKRIHLVEKAFQEQLDAVISLGLEGNPVSRIVKKQQTANKP